MDDMVDPMAEMGLTHDKQLIVEPEDFLLAENPVRDLCEHFIPQGGKLYDLIDRYDNVTSYVLNRDDDRSGDAVRMVAPFLKAFGASNWETAEFAKTHLRFLNEAAPTVSYFLQVLPTFFCSSMYSQTADALCEALHIPESLFTSTQLDLDGTEMNRQELRDLRQMATDITALPLPTAKYELNVPLELSQEEVAMIARLDDVFMHRMQGTPAFKMIQDMPSVGANEKAYTMLDIRKRTQVDLDGTAYIGGTTIDYQVMDLIKDSGGLALSFNGSEFAVHGANIAAVGNDCTVAAVLVEQFYDKGIEAVFDLVDHWTRAKVAKLELPDQNLVDSLLVRHPRKLPDVWRVDQSNVGEISAKSEAYRAKLLRPPAQQKKTPVRPAKG
ncbi:MAG: hypothetical protein PHT00_00865 [Candidatus Methanomethylophilus sp.]|nr:hypothetical protein [Methanomethylophilus sp.]MDD3232707.1 hypothetical protein [Methanomethylophilus sp.]MDD4221523.1 hypothetical protein [Methanomethylophilus sp.]MDD4668354.1 hypothetical protein [Methanomethylophilus sp.]